MLLQRRLVRGRGLVWRGRGLCVPLRHPGEGRADVARDGGHRRQRPGEEAGGAADDRGHEVRGDILGPGARRELSVLRLRPGGRLDTLTAAHAVRESANTIHHFSVSHISQIITSCAASFDNRRRAGSPPR